MTARVTFQASVLRTALCAVAVTTCSCGQHTYTTALSATETGFTRADAWKICRPGVPGAVRSREPRRRRRERGRTLTTVWTAARAGATRRNAQRRSKRYYLIAQAAPTEANAHAPLQPPAWLMPSGATISSGRSR